MRSRNMVVCSCRFHKKLGLVLSRVRSACYMYSAGLGLILSPKISLKLGQFCEIDGRPGTSRRERRRLPHAPGHCLGALEMLQQKFTFSSQGALYQGENALVPLPPCPLVIALVPLKCSSTNLQFHHRVPFTKEKMPWCPCPFKNKVYRPLDDIQDKQNWLLTLHFWTFS